MPGSEPSCAPRARSPTTTLRRAGLELDLLSRRVRSNGQTVRLSNTEFELLAYLMQHPGRVLTREQIHRAVWGYRARPGDQHCRCVHRLPSPQAAHRRPSGPDPHRARPRLQARGAALIRRSSLRWRLVAWVTGVLLLVCAVIFAVIYVQSTRQLRSQIDTDVAGDVSQLSQAVRALNDRFASTAGERDRPLCPRPAVHRHLVAPVRGGAGAWHGQQPSGAVRGRTPGARRNLRRATARERRGRRAAAGPPGALDASRARPRRGADGRAHVSVGGLSVRVGAGEPLIVVTRAERSIAKSFLIAGAIAVVLALIASYLAGVWVSRPLRRMARVAARVDDGDLHPRMRPPSNASGEIRVLAETSTTCSTGSSRHSPPSATSSPTRRTSCAPR